MKKSAVYITVRTSSSRLPGKTLKKIGKKRVIEHIIDRAKMVKNVDHVIVCTSTDPSDDILEQIAKEQGVLVFRGSLKDKLDRWLGAARKFNLDYFVEYDADDLFCDPVLLESALNQMKSSPCDYLHVPKTSISGAAGTCISVEALKKICKLKKTGDTEAYHRYFMETGLFNWREVEIKNPIFHDKKIRLTLDYIEDLRFFRKVFKQSKIITNTLPLQNIIEFLEIHSELPKINWFREAYYLKSQKKLLPPII